MEVFLHYAVLLEDGNLGCHKTQTTAFSSRIEHFAISWIFTHYLVNGSEKGTSIEVVRVS